MFLGIELSGDFELPFIPFGCPMNGIPNFDVGPVGNIWDGPFCGRKEFMFEFYDPECHWVGKLFIFYYQI